MTEITDEARQAQDRAERVQRRTTREYARVAARAMGLAGSGALSGDVIGALERLGLALVPALGYPEGYDPVAALAALTEETEQGTCPNCGTARYRLLDIDGDPETGPGVGWWHEQPDGWGFRRRCPE
jgi:hypothetical protein